jgi:integrase
MPQRRRSHWPDDPELRELLAHCSPADRAVLLLMADAGCRVGEALTFDPSSLSPQRDRLRIWGPKIKAWRTVPVTARLAAALAAFKAPFTFGPRHVQRRLLELCALAGVEETTPHRLRHSFASRLHAEGVALPLIQMLLGHKNLLTTLIYVHSPGDELQSAARALEIRAARSEKP